MDTTIPEPQSSCPNLLAQDGVLDSGDENEGVDLAKLDHDEKIEYLIKFFSRATLKEAEDMIENPPPELADIGFSVKDSQNVYHTLGSEAKALKLHRQKSLCDLCRAVSVEALCSEDGYQHAKDYATLENSSETCKLCHELLFTAQSYWDYEDSEPVTDTQISLHATGNPATGGRGFPCLETWIPEKLDTALRWTYLPLNTEIGDPASTYGIPPIRRIEDSGSPEAVRLITYWLGECMTKHCCQSFIQSPQSHLGLQERPSRLINVASPYDSGDVWLVETTTMARMPEYLALSHVWGPHGIPDHSKLLMSNFQQWQQSISLRELSANFRDAILLTRKLGFGYIWIDACCIVQDSDEDWEAESRLMGSIDTNAIMTISIDDSKDAEKGCFRAIDLEKSLPRKIEIKAVLSDGTPSTLILPEAIDAKKEGEFHNGPKALMRSPLSTRAWAYQERILSPRIIHFTKENLIWECRKHFQGLWNMLSRPTCNSAIRDISEQALLNRWYYEEVFEYSRRQLTRRTDRLPALSGLARIFSELLRAPYVAGIWMDPEKIGDALSWKPVCPFMFDFCEPWRDLAGNNCPSWSWASMKHGSTYRGYMANERTCKGETGALVRPLLSDFGCTYPMAKHEKNLVYRAGCSYDDWEGIFAYPIDPFGQVRDAWIEITGHVREARIDQENRPYRGGRTLRSGSGTKLGHADMSLDLRFDDTWTGDVLLLCLYDMGSSVSALTLIKIGENWVRIGLATLDEESKFEEWRHETVILI